MTNKKLWLGLGLVVAALAVALVFFMAARQPRDVTGWQKAAWGMSQAQVAKLYKLEPWDKGSDEPVCRLSEPVVLAGEKFRVYMYFSQASPQGQLRAVTMMAHGDVAHFASLLTELETTHGQPGGSDDTFAFKSWHWSRPSGRLEMMVVQTPSDETDPLSEEPKDVDEDNLASCSLRYFAGGDAK